MYVDTDKTADSSHKGRNSSSSSSSSDDLASHTMGPKQGVEYPVGSLIDSMLEGEYSKKKNCGSMSEKKEASVSKQRSTESFVGDENDVGIMRVRVTKTPRTDKSPQWVYPYEELEESQTTYRGYPIDGTASMKQNRNWVIQIAAPGVGAPPEALPQFPQQELLRRSGKVYVGNPGLQLSEKEVMNNSGEAWLVPGGEEPESEFFYTAGYHRDSAVKLQKKDLRSIYKSLISGTPVPVKIVTERN